MSVDLPLAGVPRACRVSESVENIQRDKNTRIKECVLSFSYNAETVSLRKVDIADADVSKENTGMNRTHVRLREKGWVRPWSLQAGEDDSTNRSKRVHQQGLWVVGQEGG
jgi:hypothetical protein